VRDAVGLLSSGLLSAKLRDEMSGWYEGTGRPPLANNNRLMKGRASKNEAIHAILKLSRAMQGAMVEGGYPEASQMEDVVCDWAGLARFVRHKVMAAFMAEPENSELDRLVEQYLRDVERFGHKLA
jgi:hypothetical protein